MLNDCGKTRRGETPAALYSSIIFCAYCSCVNPLNGIVTLGTLQLWRHASTPSFLKSSMLSACVSSSPLVGPEYRSVRKFGVPPRNCCGVKRARVERVHLAAQGLELGQRDIARPALGRCRLKQRAAGGDDGRRERLRALGRRAASPGCSWWCADRSARGGRPAARSLVKVTSHSRMPAPMPRARFVRFARVLGKLQRRAAVAD